MPDLGIQYVGLEEQEPLYDSAARRVIEKIKLEVRKRKKEEKAPAADVCGVGEQLCKFPGQNRHTLVREENA